MKIIFYLSIYFLFVNTGWSQCNYLKTVKRPDGNIIKYFNPKPVVIQSDYEVGVAIYKNITSKKFMLAITVLFKNISPQKLTQNAIIQTTNTNGIKLEPVLSQLIVMNGRDVAMGLYEITKSDYIELKNYKLKSLFFYLEGNLKGSTVTENNTLLNSELSCF
jgi:hypothetical protein